MSSVVAAAVVVVVAIIAQIEIFSSTNGARRLSIEHSSVCVRRSIADRQPNRNQQKSFRLRVCVSARRTKRKIGMIFLIFRCDGRPSDSCGLEKIENLLWQIWSFRLWPSTRSQKRNRIAQINETISPEYIYIYIWLVVSLLHALHTTSARQNFQNDEKETKL